MEAVPMPKPTRPKEGAAPVPEPAGEPKSSSETAAVTLTSAAKRPAKKGMPKGGGSSRGRLVYRPKKVVTKKAEEEEPSATGEPGVADEAPLPKTGANRGPEHQSRELCRGHRWSQRGSKLNPPDDDDDGLEITWEEESEEEEVIEEDVPVELDPRQVIMVEKEEGIVFGGEMWTCRYDVSLQDLMVETRRRALNETMRMVLPDELILNEDQLQAGSWLRWLLWMGT